MRESTSYYRCCDCIANASWKNSYQFYSDDGGVAEVKSDGFLKEPIRDPAKTVEFIDLYRGVIMSSKNNNITVNIRWICAALLPFSIVTLFFSANGNEWVFGVSMIIFFISAYVATTREHVPDVIIPNAKIKRPTLKYFHDTIFDNLTQPEASLYTKISNFPNKNKLVKQCKKYAETLIKSKTDQPIEPLLTKLYNICEAQLNVGLKENIREVECFISAIEEVEERSEVLNSNG